MHTCIGISPNRLDKIILFVTEKKFSDGNGIEGPNACRSSLRLSFRICLLSMDTSQSYWIHTIMHHASCSEHNLAFTNFTVPGTIDGINQKSPSNSYSVCLSLNIGRSGDHRASNP